MADKRLDATLKDLIEADPASWARLAMGRPIRSVAFVDADVSTLTAAADKVLLVETDAGPLLVNVELEARHAADAPGRLLLYNVVLGHRHELPVRSVLFLVRPEANATAVTGRVTASEPGEAVPYLNFGYHVVRLWRLPLQPLLEGGLGLLPLAPLTDEAAADLRGTVRLADERIREQARPEEADKIRAGMFLLLGLRYEQEMIELLSREASMFEESSTYQMLMSRGRVGGSRDLLIYIASGKLGTPDEETRARLEAISDEGRLQVLADRVLTAQSWDELLGG